MRLPLFLSTLLLLSLSACSPPTKQEALDYYEKVRFEICDDILIQLDEQQNELKSYASESGKLIDGPTSEEHTVMLANYTKNLRDLKACLVELEEIDVLGDEAEFLEAMKLYLYTRVRFEEEVVQKFITKLKGGMMPGETTFLSLFKGRMIELIEQQENLVSAEDEFIEEFKITDEEFEEIYSKYYY